MPEKRAKLLFLFIIPLFLFVVMNAFMPLLEPDEGRYSDIPSLMNQTGDYVTPQLHHVVYLEKPPLAYWATALIFKVLGESAFSARLFVALCTWGCVLIVYFIGRRFRDTRTGLYAAGVLSTFLFHYLIGKINILDMPLTFFVCLAIWMGYLYLSGEPKRRGWIYGCYVACALAFLTKGLIGIVFPFGILGLWLIVEKRWRDIPRLISPVGILALLACVLPWVILAQRANPDFLWFFFVQEHFLRYTTTMHGRAGSLFYYVPILLVGTIPWGAWLWVAVKEGSVRWRELFEKHDYRFLLVWAGLIFLFYSVSSSKLIPYLGPVFLPVAVIMGCIFRIAEDRFPAGMDAKPLYRVPVYVQSLLLIVALIIPPFMQQGNLGGDLDFLETFNWLGLIDVPIIILILMLFLPDRMERFKREGWFITIYAFSVIFMTSLVMPATNFLAPYKSAWPIAQVVKKYLPPDKELYQYDIAFYGIDFYTKLRTPIVTDWGELAPGIPKLPEAERKHYFLSSQEFYDLCRRQGEVYCVTQYPRRLANLKKEFPNLEILWSNDALFLIKIHAKPSAKGSTIAD